MITDTGKDAKQRLTFVVAGYGQRDRQSNQVYVELEGSYIRGTLGEGDYVEVAGIWTGEILQAGYILNYSQRGSTVAALAPPKIVKCAAAALAALFSLVWVLFAAFVAPLFYAEYHEAFASPLRYDRKTLEHEQLGWTLVRHSYRVGMVPILEAAGAKGTKPK